MKKQKYLVYWLNIYMSKKRRLEEITENVNKKMEQLLQVIQTVMKHLKK